MRLRVATIETSICGCVGITWWVLTIKRRGSPSWWLILRLLQSSRSISFFIKSIHGEIEENCLLQKSWQSLIHHRGYRYQDGRPFQVCLVRSPGMKLIFLGVCCKSHQIKLLCLRFFRGRYARTKHEKADTIFSENQQWECITYMTVKMGDMIAPYCADLEEDDSVPFVVGERHRIQMPHQHIILGQDVSIHISWSCCIYILSEVRRMTRPCP